MDIAPMIAELVNLEKQVAEASQSLPERDRIQRVYDMRPSKIPELPGIWNWIDDGSVDIADTARIDDVMVITATIGVRPAEMGETLGRLVRLTDVFRNVVDPALWTNQPLAGTSKRAKRIVTRTSIDEFDGVPVMCMDMLIQVELPHIIG